MASKLKFKKLNKNAVIPKQSTNGAAGLDLVATSLELVDKNETIVYSTGLAVEIPKGHVGLLFPRSSVYKTSLNLANSVGVIDEDYRGEIKAIFRRDVLKGIKEKMYNTGDRIAQLVIMSVPSFDVEEVEELSNTERGEGAFGSTGV